MPGKFEGNADEALAERLHGYTLDGSWPSLGESDGFGWYGSVSDTGTGSDEDWWYILNEDSQGFVTIVEGPMSRDECEREWAALQTEYAKWEAGLDGLEEGIG